MFNLDRDPSAARFEGVEFTCERTSKRALHFDLFLNFVEKQSGLFLECDYNSDLWDATTIERWVGHLRTLLESVTENPGESLAGLPVLSTAERLQLLSGWNNETRRDYPKDVCLHGLFEAQAQRTPEAVALIDARQRLTYRELNLQADRIAAQLRTLGVGPAVLVGVCVERSVEMVVALLAILKAGGAYVPLDPAFPRDRLAFMIEDSGMRLILTESRLVATVPAGGIDMVCLDTLPRVELAAAPTARAASTEDLAYVLYTSGSTGQPKGVQIPHRAVVNFLTSMQREPGLRPADTVLALTTLSFDIAGLELFLPLVTGAKVVVASREDVIDGQRLAKLMAASRVSVAQATPAAWRMLLESGWQGGKSLKILCGGEAIPPDLAERLLGCCGELWNMYGPTETTIWSTTCRLNAGVPITIGRPIANTEIFILDVRQQPVPVGVLGELYIGGDGLARGYHNRPELTAEKFVRHPFNPVPGARLYRTGDLARYRTDGSIEFQGRIDHQVKIRGFRIELGEIESVLCQHSSVRQAVVMARGEASGNRRLVAYLVGESPAPTVTELQEHLRRKLPEYMVPGAFVFLEKFPLTNNGKINRQSLPEPEQERPELAAAYVAPRTGIESTLAGIWSEVLEIERIGVHDHFFELGGHSLLAVRTISRIRQQLEVDMPLSTLFDAPTVAELAVKVFELQAGKLDGQDLARLLEEIELESLTEEGDRPGEDNDSDKELAH
jgi:amino acid adenylation domain-containing protein